VPSRYRTTLVFDGALSLSIPMAGGKGDKIFLEIDWIVEVTGFAGLAQR
jgi:hypothetical protein